MKTSLAALLLLTGASTATLALAKPEPQATTAIVETTAPVSHPDARSLASDQEVAEARRAYRAQCNRYESGAFCECVTAGVAQALMPSEVRIAARTIGQRITAQGDAPVAGESDLAAPGASSAMRIEQVEAHYADACASFRG